jgi:EAL domain-containing protein (putative c-di-GMP-specific phosphodiesterase class I)
MSDPLLLPLENTKGNEMAAPSAVGCGACKDGVKQPFSFSMAFQPIVNVDAGKIFAYEALVRGSNSDTTAEVMNRVTAENLYAFDQDCRVMAITLAAQLGLAESGAMLAINFIPGAVYSPAACIQLTLQTADKVGFPSGHIIFEFTENEKVHDIKHLHAIVDEYRQRGIKVALDDLGAAFSGLNILADLPVDIIKLDMALTHHLTERSAARAVVRSMVTLAKELDILLIAEGVETVETYTALRESGVSLMQGYLFAKPAFEMLPQFTLPG